MLEAGLRTLTPTQPVDTASSKAGSIGLFGAQTRYSSLRARRAVSRRLSIGEQISCGHYHVPYWYMYSYFVTEETAAHCQSLPKSLPMLHQQALEERQRGVQPARLLREGV